MPTIRTKNFGEVIRKELADDPDLARRVDNEEFNALMAMQIYKAREAAGLTQTELAKRINTTQSVISRLEDADYGGRSITLLQKIAAALGVRFRARFERDSDNGGTTTLYSATLYSETGRLPNSKDAPRYEMELPDGERDDQLISDFVGA